MAHEVKDLVVARLRKVVGQIRHRGRHLLLALDHALVVALLENPSDPVDGCLVVGVLPEQRCQLLVRSLLQIARQHLGAPPIAANRQARLLGMLLDLLVQRLRAPLGSITVFLVQRNRRLPLRGPQIPLHAAHLPRVAVVGRMLAHRRPLRRAR
ncbi:hypothetical protein ACIBO2_02380 [Nonomuraea sp. NPDC050022]|uniref:hypothetical protein n=1 Tax=Nonomuraea sp. NPDC050022 TaxID=3364358 RepID=UPI0037B8C5F4